MSTSLRPKSLARTRYDALEYSLSDRAHSPGFGSDVMFFSLGLKPPRKAQVVSRPPRSSPRAQQPLTKSVGLNCPVGGF